MLDLTVADRLSDVRYRHSSSLLAPGRNVWRVEQAGRAKVLIDAAAYFCTLREAMLNAEDTIHIVGWDLDSRVRLVGPSGMCDDGLPETLAAFLSALVQRRPRLRVRLLLWDYSLVFSLQRELAPLLSFLWRTPPQIEICLDDVLPIGACHHQKLVVIDDALAFSGGLDITIRRWDTPEHRPGDPLRLDPAATPYPPFHDVQMAVDGAAAAALGELVRARWERAACEKLRRPPAPGMARDPWPESLTPDFRDVPVGIARTFPRYGRQEAVTEVATLFEDMAARADRLVYIENQFLTHTATAERLAARMVERPQLEAIIIAPRSYDGWVERRVMLAGRLRFMRVIEQAGVGDRVRLLYPRVQEGDLIDAVMVHSKVMIVDDTALRVGSANLCNRSMGLDTECDLVVEAKDEASRRGIAAIRNQLLAEHSGLEASTFEEALRQGRSLCQMLDQSAPTAHGLHPVDDRSAGFDISEAVIDAMADPVEPLDEERTAIADQPSRLRVGLVVRIGIALAAIALLALVWHLSPLSDPARITQAIDAIADRPWAPLAVIAIFLLTSLVAFPVTLLIFATIAVFGGWTGALLAAAGAMASAMAGYFVGKWLGARFLRRFIGPRLNRVRRVLSERGVLTVAAVRIVPAAPFTVVNLVAGAIGLRFLDYAAGTAMGLLPGLIVMSALGNQIATLFARPTAGGVALLLCFIIAWMALAIGLQFLAARYRSRG
ncbi:MAG: associated Golgi protein-like protein [Xanthobacteraceae bacterium]|nr:associated Golgi protein-like protein [Xanthobacteraceae bacterium]